MTLHVFVATTQGLVVIQNIIPIDDEDIRSIVSVNGTSTTTNISSSYHNFVKKGAGIIEDEFGACSYRVNISERIDQGNSWQLPFYLAHAAFHQGKLGDGNVKSGDRVVCATGEINTTTGQVLAIGHIAAKISFFRDSLALWREKNVDALMLMPALNKEEVKKLVDNQANQIATIDNLENALVLLNLTTNVIKGSNKGNGERAGELTIKAASNTPWYYGDTRAKLINSLVKKSPVVLFSLLLPIALYFGFSDENNLRFAGSTKSNAGDFDSQLPVLVIKPFKRRGGKCQAIEENEVRSSELGLVAATSMLNLCRLEVTQELAKHLIIVAKDSYAVITAEKTENTWLIPIPKFQNIDREYFIIALFKNTDGAPTEVDTRGALRNSLLSFINQSAENDTVDVNLNLINEWIEEEGIHAGVYTHTLLTF